MSEMKPVYYGATSKAKLAKKVPHEAKHLTVEPLCSRCHTVCLCSRLNVTQAQTIAKLSGREFRVLCEVCLPKEMADVGEVAVVIATDPEADRVMARHQANMN